MRVQFRTFIWLIFSQKFSLFLDIRKMQLSLSLFDNFSRRNSSEKYSCFPSHVDNKFSSCPRSLSKNILPPKYFLLSYGEHSRALLIPQILQDTRHSCPLLWFLTYLEGGHFIIFCWNSCWTSARGSPQQCLQSLALVPFTPLLCLLTL